MLEGAEAGKLSILRSFSEQNSLMARMNFSPNFSALASATPSIRSSDGRLAGLFIGGKIIISEMRNERKNYKRGHQPFTILWVYTHLNELRIVCEI